MADCERLNKCPFFSGQMANMPSVTDLMKKKYCFGDKTECARYQVASAGIAVPLDLFPHEISRARDIVRKR